LASQKAVKNNKEIKNSEYLRKNIQTIDELKLLKLYRQLQTQPQAWLAILEYP
jgi:hypothetical protein